MSTISFFINKLPSTLDYASWRSSNLDAVTQKISPEVHDSAGNATWGRLIAQWNEKVPNGETRHHTYAAVVDLEDGGLYLDCRPSLIFVKCLTQLLIRPFHTIAKTIYHISLLPIFSNIPALIKQKMAPHQFLLISVRCIADIIRTPIYGAVLVAASVAALAKGVFQPSSLYDSRKLIGKVEAALNHGKIHSDWTLAPCFQPFPLEVLADYGIQNFNPDTLYPSDNPLDRQLTNFARSRIRHMQKECTIFGCRKLPKDVAYISPILTETCKKHELHHSPAL